MPRKTIPHSYSRPEGTVFTRIPAEKDGMEFQNNENQVLVVKNSGKATLSVKVHYAPDQHGRTGVRELSVEAGEEKVIGPFNRTLFNQRETGNMVHVDFSFETNVTVGVISIQS